MNYIRSVVLLLLFGSGIWISFTVGYFSGYERRNLAAINSSWKVYKMAEHFIRSTPEELDCQGHLVALSEWIWGDIMIANTIHDEKRSLIAEAIYFPFFLFGVYRGRGGRRNSIN